MEWRLLKLKSPVIASVAWQSLLSCRGSGDCFVPRNDSYFCLSKRHSGLNDYKPAYDKRRCCL